MQFVKEIKLKGQRNGYGGFAGSVLGTDCEKDKY